MWAVSFPLCIPFISTASYICAYRVLILSLLFLIYFPLQLGIYSFYFSHFPPQLSLPIPTTPTKFLPLTYPTSPSLSLLLSSPYLLPGPPPLCLSHTPKWTFSRPGLGEWLIIPGVLAINELKELFVGVFGVTWFAFVRNPIHSSKKLLMSWHLYQFLLLLLSLMSLHFINHIEMYLFGSNNLINISLCNSWFYILHYSTICYSLTRRYKCPSFLIH